MLMYLIERHLLLAPLGSNMTASPPMPSTPTASSQEAVVHRLEHLTASDSRSLIFVTMIFKDIFC